MGEIVAGMTREEMEFVIYGMTQAEWFAAQDAAARKAAESDYDEEVCA